MAGISYALFLVVLLLIAYQDFKQREISWFTLPLIVIFYLYQTSLSLAEVINLSLVNIGFVFFVLVMITIYYSVKNSKVVNIVNQYLGIGDILFFIVCCLLFDLPNFLLFFISSLFLSIIVAYFLKTNKDQATIPLAGIMSLCLLVLSVTDKFSSVKLFRNSDWLNTLIVS